MAFLFGRKKKNTDEEDIKAHPSDPQLTILVFDGNPAHDWSQMFRKYVSLDESLRIVQTSWINCASVIMGDCRCVVAPVRDTHSDVVAPRTIQIKVDFAIIRNQPRGVTQIADRRNVLYGLMMGNVQSVNSLQSIYMNLERPLMFGALKAIEAKVGRDQFPVIDQTYYSTYRQMIVPPELPAVLKIDHAHAGMGKMKIESAQHFRDIATILALDDHYCTAEQFIESDYGIRVQKIGNHYRVMKKNFTGVGWKSHFGGTDLQEIELTDDYKRWADLASECFGGMDILALDAMVGKDGKEYIIELNGTACGFLPNRWEEDTSYVLEVVQENLTKMRQISTNS